MRKCRRRGLILLDRVLPEAACWKRRSARRRGARWNIRARSAATASAGRSRRSATPRKRWTGAWPKAARKASCARCRVLRTAEPPQRIEVYDNSHIQGTNALGAMVVAGPEGFIKNQYRKWNIKTQQTNDDFAMMREVMERRFGRLLSESPSPSASRTVWRSCWPTPGGGNRATGKAAPEWPDLVLIDGGKGQVSAVKGVLEELGVEDVPLIGIAKGPHHGREGREVFHFPDGREKTLPVNSPVLFYLQRLRDEVHRYAIGAHRTKRSEGRSPRAARRDARASAPRASGAAAAFRHGAAKCVRRALRICSARPACRAAVAQAVHDYYHAG
jgi:excinuclease ABC subunit C